MPVPNGDLICESKVPEQVSHEWCTLNCATTARRDDSDANEDCPPEYCECPDDLSKAFESKQKGSTQGQQAKKDQPHATPQKAPAVCDFDAQGCIKVKGGEGGEMDDCRSCAMHFSDCMAKKNTACGLHECPEEGVTWDDCVDEITSKAEGCKALQTKDCRQAWRVRAGDASKQEQEQEFARQAGQQAAASTSSSTCKSIYPDRGVSDDWCDQVCLMEGGGHVATDDGCDPDYCDCPWKQEPPSPKDAFGKIIEPKEYGPVEPKRSPMDAAGDQGAPVKIVDDGTPVPTRDDQALEQAADANAEARAASDAVREEQAQEDPSRRSTINPAKNGGSPPQAARSPYGEPRQGTPSTSAKGTTLPSRTSTASSWAGRARQEKVQT